jgi:D-alanyl-D-alanine carboxypeptidase
VRSRILSPLGMSQSLSAILNADRHRFVGGTVPENDELPWLPGDRLAQAQWLEATGGDGNVASTASDLGKFAAALVAIGNQNPDGSTGTPRLFPTAMFTDLAAAGEPILEIGAHEPILASNYGYGLNVERVARGLMLSHGGGMVGYASFMLADLASGISVVVLTNAQGDQPIAELLARDLHLGLVELLADDDVIGYSPRHDRRLDPRRWGADEPGTGRFHSLSEPSLELTIAHLPDGSRTVTVAGETAELLWTLNGRATTAHPLLREYHLRFQPGQDKTGTAAGWVSGPREFRSAVGSDLAPPTGHAQNGRSPYLGRFRSYSPWFPYFEIVERSGGLVLCAPGGVEAPDDDIELVEIAPGRFRLGSDPRAPERLTFGPLSDGAAISANRDGCDYARQGRVVPTAPRTPLDAPVDVPTDVPSDVPSATTTVKRVSK